MKYALIFTLFLFQTFALAKDYCRNTAKPATEDIQAISLNFEKKLIETFSSESKYKYAKMKAIDYYLAHKLKRYNPPFSIDCSNNNQVLSDQTKDKEKLYQGYLTCQSLINTKADLIKELQNKNELPSEPQKSKKLVDYREKPDVLKTKSAQDQCKSTGLRCDGQLYNVEGFVFYYAACCIEPPQ